MKLKSILLGMFFMLTTANLAMAVPTQITVRVLTKGAKFLGTSMGGALVTIKDVHTGKLFAEGLTSGGTGDTERIMRTPLSGETPLSDEGAASFTATIDIESPRLIEVSAYGPMANRQAANKVSATQWVVPGKHITQGDAWLILMPGMAVDVLAPPAHITLAKSERSVRIDANVIMM
ncbi:MAG: hypothetical protein AAGU11_17115 [Syntrophobacteraceae bacterium]